MDVLTTTPSSVHFPDDPDEDTSEAQAQVIASLRAQVTDLFSQVTQLNGKLVASYDRMSDLEDQFHHTSSSLRNASVTISSLELERSHHLAALNTGLLVEKAHVTAELNRLMERATEEAAQRGQAESARHDIEKDLDDLSASLFDQANTMVAEARLNQAKSERKVQDAEKALKIAEDAVQDMQVQMQVLQAEKESAERDACEAKFTARKGKWAEHDDSPSGDVPRIRFMTTHTPYAEFISFVSHLRGLRGSQLTPPVIASLLTQPFISRLLTEDSEPTVRLDLAPSLNWLSRRSVLGAIHSGMLTVEPLPFSSLVQELHQHPQSMSNSSLSCALCGTLIARLSSTSPVSRATNANGSSWFKYPLALGSSQNHGTGILQSTQSEPPGAVYVFRLAVAGSSTPPPSLTPAHTSSASMSAVGTSTRPPLTAISSTRVLQTQVHNSPYPLCISNYCLTRLRSTCSLWAFVRVGIVERIWEEGVAPTPKPVTNGEMKEAPSPTSSSTGNQPINSTNVLSPSDKPPVPPRRRRLWEMASALGERAVSWGKESAEKDKDKEPERENTKKFPIPPSHPSAPHPHPHAESSIPRPDSHDPPPLPKRSVIREKVSASSIAPPSDIQNGVAVPEAKDVAPEANGHPDPGKTDPPASGPSSPLDITFASPSTETSPLPFKTLHSVAAESTAPPAEEPVRPSSPHTIPLPMTPATPTPVSHPSSPAPRPRSQISSPGSPPLSSRPTSPAVTRSRAGSPASAGIGRTTSPSPGQSPTIPHMRGKISISSPLVPPLSRPTSPSPATGSSAPPLPRRAAARRAVPPQPATSANPRAVGDAGKEEQTSSAVSVAETTAEEGARKPGGGECPADRKSQDGEGCREGIKESETVAHGASAASAPTATVEVVPGPSKGIIPGDASTPHTNGEGVANGTAATVPSDLMPPPVSEGSGHMSMDTANTKRSSSVEDEGFASDTTWEERTWKELVRLKEDMFWARIGGVRAAQV